MQIEVEHVYSGAGLELGRWLANRWSWDAFATLTFRDPPPTNYNLARRYTAVGRQYAEHALRRWLRDMVRSQAPGARWWFVEEPHRGRSTPHLHGLLGGIRHTDWSLMWEAWWRRCGLARIEPVRRADAVAVYVAKYVNKGDGRIWMGGLMPTSPWFPGEEAMQKVVA